MFGIRYRLSFKISDHQQIVRPYHSRDSFVVYHHPASPQFRSDPPIAVALPMFQDDLLDGRSHCDVLFRRSLALEKAVESRSADLRRQSGGQTEEVPFALPNGDFRPCGCGRRVATMKVSQRDWPIRKKEAVR